MVEPALPDLLVRNGTLIGSAGRFAADIVCTDGRIEALLAPGTNASADETVDADGLLVFPGFIDAHVHSRDPGLTHKEDFAHSTEAAAFGGVTTLLEMPNSVPPVTDVATMESRRDHLQAQAVVDFGMWAMALGEANLEDLPALFEAGVVGAKIFWGYALDRASLQLTYTYGDRPAAELVPPPDTAAVWAILRTAAQHDGLIGAHCENRELVVAGERALGHKLVTYDDLLEVRSEATEATAIALAIELVRSTGARFHVVHLSSARGAELVREAKQAALPVSAETCPQYLFLTKDAYTTVGPHVKVYPPIRDGDNQATLVRALCDGTIDIVASDHAPHTVDEKRLPLDRQPAGVLGTETMGPLMIDAMLRGQFSSDRVRRVLSERPARLFGLHPRKGEIAIGADADFTIVDPAGTTTVTSAGLHSKQQLTPWDGVQLRGRIRTVILRGSLVIYDGQRVGAPHGTFIAARRSTVTERPA